MKYRYRDVDPGAFPVLLKQVNDGLDDLLIVMDQLQTTFRKIRRIAPSWEQFEQLATESQPYVMKKRNRMEKRYKNHINRVYKHL